MPAIWLTSDTHFGHEKTCTVFTRADGTPLRPFASAEEMDDLWFRYEYQTFDTVIAGETSVFLVKTVTKPYQQYVDTDQKHEIVRRVINSMSDAVLTYKNLHEVRDILNRT